MELNVVISELTDGRLRVSETAYADGAYAADAEDQFSRGTVLFAKSASVTVVRLVRGGEETDVGAFIHDHSSADVSNVFAASEDGRHHVTHMVVPTFAWLDDAEEYGHLDDYTHLYVTDGVRLYERVGGTDSGVDFDEVLANAEGSSVFVAERDVYRLWGMRSCYYAHCAALLDAGCRGACPDCSSAEAYMTDLIWIVLNDIMFLASNGRWDEADALLEEMEGTCGAVCGKWGGLDCGCRGGEPEPDPEPCEAGFVVEVGQEGTCGAVFGVGAVAEEVCASGFRVDVDAEGTCVSGFGVEVGLGSDGSGVADFTVRVRLEGGDEEEKNEKNT